MAHQIETDFTLYLLAPACDNRLDRKSNGEGDGGAEEENRLHTMCVCVCVHA